MKVLIGISGASGVIYAQDLISTLSTYDEVELSIIFSQTAEKIWEAEVENRVLPSNVSLLSNNDFHHQFASGSNSAEAMVILPCSMGTLGRIASGISSTLIERAADVQMKENKKLIIVPREAPLNLIHINNMKVLAESGAIIFPASPAFYCKPSSIQELVHNFSLRIISTLGITPKEVSHVWQK